MRTTETWQSDPTVRARGSLAVVVEGIGTERFGSSLLEYLHDRCGADHCTVFQLGSDAINVVAVSSSDSSQRVHSMVEHYVGDGTWRKDPVISSAGAWPGTATTRLLRLDLHSAEHASYRELRAHLFPRVGDRIVVGGRRDNIDFCLSVVRADLRPAFGSRAVEQLSAVADTLISTIAKHVSVLGNHPNVASALMQLSEIEDCIIGLSELPRRESEVCARILYGLSTLGISVDLGLREESVKTYRKRAYRRLNISCERELLNWYLSKWSACRGHLYAPPARPSPFPGLTRSSPPDFRRLR